MGSAQHGVINTSFIIVVTLLLMFPKMTGAMTDVTTEDMGLNAVTTVTEASTAIAGTIAEVSVATDVMTETGDTTEVDSNDGMIAAALTVTDAMIEVDSTVTDGMIAAASTETDAMTGADSTETDAMTGEASTATGETTGTDVMIEVDMNAAADTNEGHRTEKEMVRLHILGVFFEVPEYIK